MQEDKHNSENNFRLTDWSVEPTLAELKADFREAERTHSEQMTRIERWMDNLYIRNKAKPKTAKGNSSVAPKLIRKQAEWRYPALSEPFLSSERLLNVLPRTWEDTENSNQVSLLLNYYFDTYTDKVKLIDEYVRTAVDEGTVILRTGWRYEETTVKEMAPEYSFTPSPQLQPQFEAMAELKEYNPTEFRTQVVEGWLEAFNMFVETGIPYLPTKVGEVEVETTKVLANHPTVEICDSNDVLIDPSCNGDISKARFIIYRYTSDRSELEASGLYTNLRQISDSSPSHLTGSDDAFTADRSFNFDDKPRKKLTVYEYWGFRDIDGDGIVEPFVATWVGNTMIRMEENPYPDKALPFVVVPYMPVRKHIYGEPDGELLEENQKIMGAVTRGMVDILAKSANGQTGMRKGTLDPINRRKYEAGEDYEYNGAADPRNNIFMHTYAEIPASAQFMLQAQNMEAESLTGVKSFNQGMSGQSLGEVAAGVRGMLDASAKREAAILRRLAGGIIEVARKWLSMAGEFMDMDEVIRITNKEFSLIRPDDIQGTFDIKLEISTAEENNAQAQELAFMLQTMGNNLDFGVVKTILIKIAKLRRMPDVAKQIEEYEPQPDPVEQELKMLEKEKLLAEIEEIRARTADYMASSQAESTKAMKNAAEASLIQSQTDQANLDFVEQESGVKQERDLQKQRAQSEGNIELEHVKAGLAQKQQAEERVRNFFNAQR